MNATGTVFRVTQAIGFFSSSKSKGWMGPGTTILYQGSIIVLLNALEDRSIFMFENEILYRHDTIEEMMDDLEWIEIV